MNFGTNARQMPGATVIFFHLSKKIDSARIFDDNHAGTVSPPNSTANPFAINEKRTELMPRFCFVFFAFVAFLCPADAQPLIFSVTGCGPYKPDEKALLARYVDEVSADGKSEFLVHLGDIFPGSVNPAPESEFITAANILKRSQIPVLIVPGDNEWNDQKDPKTAWKFWTKQFGDFEKNFAKAPLLERQAARPENFALSTKGVLVLGLNIVGGRVHDAKEWKTRHGQNNDWVKEQLAKQADTARALVVLAQAEPNATHDSFFKPFVEQIKGWGKPTLYIHADGHKWEVHKKWRADNLLRVQTDMVGVNPPVIVTVTDNPNEPFQFERRKKK